MLRKTRADRTLKQMDEDDRETSTEGRPIESVLEEIEDVWGEQTEFEEWGLPFVAFLIEQDVSDMREEEWDEEECIEELADVCINSLRMMQEKGYDPEKVIHNRLQDHREKQPSKLVEKYSSKFEGKTK